MANNNVQNVRFLRNGSLYATREAALNKLNSQKLAAEQDGSIILARYGSGNTVKTLVGFVYVNGENKSLTIFDIEGASGDVENLRQEINAKLGDGITNDNTATAQLTALSGNSSSKSGDTSVEGAKRYADGLIDALNVNAIVAGDGEFIKSVSEVDGKIAATAAEMPTVPSISNKGQAITAVSQSKGAVSASFGDIAAAHVTVDDSGKKFTASTVEAVLAEIDTAYKAADTAIIGGASPSANTLGAIEGIINQIKTDEKTYTIEAITSGLASNVRRAYKLVDEDGTQSGATIEIYNDSSLQSVELVNEDPTQKPAKEGQFLKFTYITDSGTTDVVYLDVSTFLVEAEFKDGLQTNNGEVSIKLDTTGDDTGNGKFLTVGANGLKLDGVTDAIGTAISGLYVSDTAVAGQYVSQVSETDGKIAVVRANVSEAVLNNYSKGSTSGAVASTDTVNQAISKLEVRIDGELAALNADVSGNSTHVTVGVKEENGKVTAVTVSESNIANADDLSSEIAARKAVDGQDGQTYVANSGKKFISGATSLNGADVALNDALENVDSKYVSGVTVNGKAVTVSNHVAPISINAAAGTGAETKAIAVNTDNSTGAVTISLLGLDCGTY